VFMRMQNICNALGCFFVCFLWNRRFVDRFFVVHLVLEVSFVICYKMLVDDGE
jgi:hypothetical protein